MWLNNAEQSWITIPNCQIFRTTVAGIGMDSQVGLRIQVVRILWDDLPRSHCW